MNIVLGADHAGFELKNQIAGWLQKAGHDVQNLGTDSGSSVDYPDFAAAVAQVVASGEADRGVLVCGTGVGMAMTANRITGVRATNCTDVYTRPDVTPTQRCQRSLPGSSGRRPRPGSRAAGCLSGRGVRGRAPLEKSRQNRFGTWLMTRSRPRS